MAARAELLRTNSLNRFYGPFNELGQPSEEEINGVVVKTKNRHLFSIATPGVRHAINATTHLGPDDVPQPDGLLRIVPECGGQARLDAKGYLQGAPEFVVEVAASTVSLDARGKLASYRRAGVREYLVWRTEDEAIDWWVLEEDEYRLLPAGPDGILRSKVFSGLWLETAALLGGDGARLMARLQEGLQSPEHAAFLAELRKRAGLTAGLLTFS